MLYMIKEIFIGKKNEPKRLRDYGYEGQFKRLRDYGQECLNSNPGRHPICFLFALVEEPMKGHSFTKSPICIHHLFETQEATEETLQAHHHQPM